MLKRSVAAEWEDDAAPRQAGMKLAQAPRRCNRLRILRCTNRRWMLRPPPSPNCLIRRSCWNRSIQHELGDYQSAAAAFSRLITTRKLGQAVYTVEDNGQQKIVDNDQYWEAILKLTRCNQKLGTGIEESKNYLKLQYITWAARGRPSWPRMSAAAGTDLDFKPEGVERRPGRRNRGSRDGRSTVMAADGRVCGAQRMSRWVVGFEVGGLIEASWRRRAPRRS
jgi:hypothetical protein